MAAAIFGRRLLAKRLFDVHKPDLVQPGNAAVDDGTADVQTGERLWISWL